MKYRPSAVPLLGNAYLEGDADHPPRFRIGHLVRLAELVDFRVVSRIDHGEAFARLLRIIDALLRPLSGVENALNKSNRNDLRGSFDLFDLVLLVEITKERRRLG